MLVWPNQIVFGQELIDDVKSVEITNGSEIKNVPNNNLITVNNDNDIDVVPYSAIPNDDSNEKRITRNIFYPPPFFGGFPGRRFGGFYGRRRFFRRRRFGFYG